MNPIREKRAEILAKLNAALDAMEDTYDDALDGKMQGVDPATLLPGRFDAELTLSHWGTDFAVRSLPALLITEPPAPAPGTPVAPAPEEEPANEG